MNCYERNLDISIKILDKLKLDPRVEGVAFLGGVARKYADEYSDIDIVVFSDEVIMDLPVGERFYDENIDIEIFNKVMSEYKWNEQKKETYQEGCLVYDKSGKVREFLNKNLEYKNEDFLHNYIDRLFSLAWHGFVYTPYRNKYIRGYKWILPPDLWKKRNNISNGYLVLNQCAITLIEMMFVINRKWIPSTKWLWIKVLKLDYLPDGFEKKMSYILFEKDSEETYELKIQYLNELLDESFDYVNDLLPDNLYEYVDISD